jgi:hypothetical protein
MKRKAIILVIGISVLLLDSFLAFGMHSQPTDVSIPDVEVFRGGKQFAFMFSWDDGGDDLAFSFLEDELGFKHTTFAVTSRIESRKLWGLDMLFRGHDIQSHSRQHLHHAQLNSSYREYLLRQSVNDIETVYGFTPIVFAYPYGSVDITTQEQVSKFFRLARGIQYESTLIRGTWPIENQGRALHSFPSVDGVKGTNMNRLVNTFEEMVTGAGSAHAAYKCYGHSKWFTPEERSDFFELLKQIAMRKDTWYTSWGESVAYQLERQNVRISSYHKSKHSISFTTEVDDEFSFGVALTYRIEIPGTWAEFTVSDGGKFSDYYRLVRENESLYLLLDSVPRGQTIEIVPYSITDAVNPRIENMRALVTREGAAFLADILDDHSRISNVDIAINGVDFHTVFLRVQNPIFWSNSTYGRVVFGLPNGMYDFTVTASDSFGNEISKTQELKVNWNPTSQFRSSSNEEGPVTPSNVSGPQILYDTF